MNAKGLLDQLLASGQSMLGGQGTASSAGRTGFPGGDFGKGALAGSALGLLLGNKKVRKMGGGALKYGSAAALGAFAYKAYNDWQQQQGVAGAPAAMEPRTLDRLPSAQAELHSRAVLSALVAASKSDGHIDERERELIHRELGKVAGDAETRQWLDAEVARPLDPADVARAATSPELAAEMYLASLLAVDQQSFMERAYLDELARQMQLPAGLKEKLEAEASARGG